MHEQGHERKRLLKNKLTKTWLCVRNNNNNNNNNKREKIKKKEKEGGISIDYSPGKGADPGDIHVGRFYAPLKH